MLCREFYTFIIIILLLLFFKWPMTSHCYFTTHIVLIYTYNNSNCTFDLIVLLNMLKQIFFFFSFRYFFLILNLTVHSLFIKLSISLAHTLSLSLSHLISISCFTYKHLFCIVVARILQKFRVKKVKNNNKMLYIEYSTVKRYFSCVWPYVCVCANVCNYLLNI